VLGNLKLWKNSGRGWILFAWAVLAIATLASSVWTATEAQAQHCPRGQIPCWQLCDIAGGNARECKFGRRDSCMSHFNSINKCVGRNTNMRRESREMRGGRGGGGGSCPDFRGAMRSLENQMRQAARHSNYEQKCRVLRDAVRLGRVAVSSMRNAPRHCSGRGEINQVERQINQAQALYNRSCRESF
jgi:hypothetical protein